MTEIKRDLHEDLKIMTLIPKDPNEPVDMVHDVVTPHALRRAIVAEEEVGRLRKALENLANKPIGVFGEGFGWEEHYKWLKRDLNRVLKSVSGEEVES